MKERIQRFTKNEDSHKTDFLCLAILVMLVLSIYLVHFLNSPVFFVDGTDDHSAYLISKQNLFTLVSSQYHGWTGRITGVILSYVSTNTGLIFYRVINPLFFVLSGYAIARYFSERVNVRRFSLALLCLGLISGGALGESVFWYSGSYSYGVVVALGLFAMIPYADSFFRKENELGVVRFIPFAIAGILATMGNEQAAIVMVGAALFFHIAKWTKKEKISPLFYVLTIILIVFTALDVLSPGNANRRLIEMSTRFPDFDQLSVVAHLKLASYCFFTEMAGRFAIIMCALAFIILYEYKRITGRWRWLSVILLAQLALAFVAKVLAVLLHNYETGVGRLFNFKIMLDYYNVSTQSLMHKLSPDRLVIGYFPYLFWAVFFVILIVLTCKMAERPVFVLLCFCAALVTLAAFYTSPTLLVSGERAYYVAFIVFVIVTYYRLLQTGLIQKYYTYLALSALFAARIGWMIKDISTISH